MAIREPYAVRLERIRESVAKQRESSARKTETSTAGRIRSDVTKAHWFALQVGMAAHWMYRHVLRPVSRVLWWPAKRLWGAYRRLWDRVVYVRFHDTRRFSKTRAGLLLTATLGFFYVPILNISPFLGTVEFTTDAGLYLFTAHHEQIYLTNTHEIDPEGNMFSVQGGHQLPITDQDSIYFRVRPVLFHQLWSITHHSWRGGPPFFFPDYVAAAVPPGVSYCSATSYGIRWKWFMRNADWYPDLLAASCVPLTNGERG